MNIIRICRSLFVLCFLMAGNTAISQETTDAQRWLEYTTLAPDFCVAKTRKAFEKQRKEVRETLWQLLGNLPQKPKVPEAKTLSREDKGSYWLERFEFDNGAGATVPGVLLLPKNISAKSPAILWHHWHGGQYDGGKIEIFETKHTPAPPGPTLAERGYVVLAIDAYCFGERNGRGPGGANEKGGAGEMTASKFNLWTGRTLWGMMVRDDLMALDYLCSRSEVDAQRVGVTGISMGATRTWWLMALDDRPKAAVAVCCLTRYRDLIDAQLLKAHGIYYFVPGLLNHFDTEAVIACIAPRAFLSVAGGDDGGSPVPGIRKIESSAGPAWKLFDKTDNFRSVIYPGVGHVYTPEMWQEMLNWFDKRLGKTQ
ncbi:MAG: alpha/beta hydrolase family protein [Kiritimatiellae bacterium]|nr:alpha/beta hydrolase family protein [Kiritimatiellia bacterium]MDD5520076.1 alpha/beta hydrolase family protein [Kiritimatiellia bacterium]